MEVRNVGAPGPSPASLQPSREQPKARATRQENSSGDRIEISAGARDAALAAELARGVLAMGEIRPEVVEAARSALESGELDRPEAALETARAIARGA